MIDYSKFQKALKNLSLQYDNYQNTKHRSGLSDLDKEAIAESVIQRFEICYDCLWKVLKRYLTEDLGLAELPNSPKPIFRLANENQLLVSIDAWLTYADMRTDTAHDYDRHKAEKSLANMADFIVNAMGLYQTMTGESWK